MSRIDENILRLRKQKDGVFMPFLVIGDPNLDQCLEITRALIHTGADFLEFGFPYSDPPADGPIIQAASQRALQQGTTTADAFRFLRKVRLEFDGPIVLLLYFNLIFKQGISEFYARARDAGVDGILVADVPLEESAPLIHAAGKNEIDQIFIAAPSTKDERLQAMSEIGSGFVYGVTRIGITGEQATISDTLPATITRIQEHADLPCLAGFGISMPSHVSDVMHAGADGAICGSAIIRRIAEQLDTPSQMLHEISSFSQSMKQATVGALNRQRNRGT